MLPRFIDRTRTVFFLCDLQEAFRPVLSESGRVVRTASRMVEAARILNIPLLLTEQSPDSTPPGG